MNNSYLIKFKDGKYVVITRYPNQWWGVTSRIQNATRFASQRHAYQDIREFGIKNCEIINEES